MHCFVIFIKDAIALNFTSNRVGVLNTLLFHLPDGMLIELAWVVSNESDEP